MPLDEGDDEDPRIIMSIIPELAIPFDTKKRAPFRCVFETVKLSEIIKLKAAQTDVPYIPTEEEAKFNQNLSPSDNKS